MEQRQLGADGPEISVLGIGTAPIGSGADWIDWGAQDEAEAVAAIHAGLAAGASWIDTAPFYGWGRAEEIVGRAIAGRREDVLLFTKCGTLPSPGALSREDNSPETIRADLEASLRRLGVDNVDLLQIHDVDAETPIEDSWGEIQSLIGEGKVRWGGLSNHSAEVVARAHALAPVTTCQDQLSLLAEPDDPGIPEFVRTHGIGLLCWAPLASGFLTDAFSLDALEPDDFRRRSRLAGRGPEIERHRVEAHAQGKTLQRHAIDWVLDQPGVTAAIVGVRNAREGAELAALAGQ